MSQTLARAFSEWNRMLIDQQNWDIQREGIRAEKEMGHMMNVEKAKDMAIAREQTQLQIQNQRNENIKNEFAVMGIKEYMKPAEMNIYNFLPRGFHEDPEQLEAAKNVFRDIDPNIKFSLADGRIGSQVSGPFGTVFKPVSMGGMDRENRGLLLEDIRLGFEDSPLKWEQEYKSLLPQYEQALADHKKYRGKPRADAQAERIKAWNKIKEIEPRVNFLRENLTDSGILKHYADRAVYFDKRAKEAALKGQLKLEEFYTGRANALRKKEEQYYQAKAGKGQGSIVHKPYYDNDPSSDTYGQEMGSYRGTIMSMPDLPGNRSWTQPKKLSKGDSDDIDSGQALNNIEQIYTTAQRGAVIQDPLLGDKQATHEYAFNTFKKLVDKNGKRVFTNAEAQAESTMYMKAASNGFFTAIEDYKGKDDTATFQTLETIHSPNEKIIGWDQLPQEEKVLHAQRAKYFKHLVKTGKLTKQMINDSPKKAAMIWELSWWKKRVADDLGLEDPDLVYTPSKYTRSQQKRMERMGSKFYEKELTKE